MSPVVTEILQQIDRLPLVEQTKILRQLEQKIETATAHEAASPNSIGTSQQQWRQAIDRIHNQTPISRKPELLICSPNLTKMKMRKTSNKP
jgi:hypothetical protein